MESRTKTLTERQAREIADEVADNLASRARRAKAAAIDSARAAYQLAQNKAKASARVTDDAIHEHPYSSLGLAFGAGLLFGFILKRR